jgi:pyruvate dehydrogenase E1 component alpha subunit
VTLPNFDAPVARREALESRREQLARMMEIRAVEERIQRLYSEGEIRGSTHLANGQEAVAVGVACATRADDVVTCTYRGHGHALALGATPLQVIAEICGRESGAAGGVGGSMHLMEPSVGLLPTFAIVGAGLPVACGAALAARTRGTDNIAVAIFGDGSTNIGAFHEAMNFAAIRKLPMLFVCENNLYGEYTRIEKSTPVSDLAVRAASYAMASAIVDGQDVDAVAEAVATAAAQARSGDGPTFLEMKTYRYSGHSRSDPATYRPAGELAEWQKRDPIDIFAARLAAEGAIGHNDADGLRAAAADAVEEATQAALSSAHPSQEAILAHVTAASPGANNRWNFWSKSTSSGRPMATASNATR